MPYVKSIPIRSTVNRSIAYILNPSKTDDLLYIDGINVVADKALAYQQFKNIYIHHNALNNKNKNLKKRPILAHHFVQSFKEGDVTPEIAKKIGYEWAKRVFGENHQVVIATHNDKGHIHNHFIVNAYGFNGKKFYSNKTSLNRLRAISDEISLEYGIQPIIGNNRKGVHYKEWMEKKKGTSWKEKIRLAIDKAILKSNSIEDVLNELKKQGFEVKRGKYISVRPKYLKRFVRIHNLGGGYSEQEIMQRIKEKYKDPIIQLQQMERPGTTRMTKQRTHKKSEYRGIQLKYVSLIRLLAKLIMDDKKPVRKVYRKKPYSVQNDYDVYTLASHLRFLNREGIESADQLYQKMQEVKNEFEKAKESINRLNSLSATLENVITHANTYFRLLQDKNFSRSSKLKFSIAKSICEKYNIRKMEDIEKLTNELNKVNDEREKLRNTFDSLNQRYKEVSKIVETYRKISDNTYLDSITKDRSKERDER